MSQKIQFHVDPMLANSSGGKLLERWVADADKNDELAQQGGPTRFEMVKSPEFAAWVRSLGPEGQNWLAIALTFSLAKRDKKAVDFSS